MEAYGFIKIVEKFCNRELICIIKIISDNKTNIPNNTFRSLRKIPKHSRTLLDMLGHILLNSLISLIFKF